MTTHRSRRTSRAEARRRTIARSKTEPKRSPKRTRGAARHKRRIVMPHSEEVRVAGSAGRYLIAHRRGAGARGVRPLSANEMQNAVKGIPGVEIVKVVKASRQVGTFSATTGESSDTFV